MAALSASQCAIYFVPIADVRPDHDDDFITFEDHELEKLTALVKERYPGIRRGDMINVLADDDRYRNDGTHAWDGEKAIPLDEEPDEYGTVPRQFEVTETEFAPDWWRAAVCHNNYWWPSKITRDQAVANIKRGSLPFLKEEVWYTTFDLQGKAWTLVFDQDNDLSKQAFVSSLQNQPYEYIDDFAAIDYTTVPDLVCRVFSIIEYVD